MKILTVNPVLKKITLKCGTHDVCQELYQHIVVLDVAEMFELKHLYRDLEEDSENFLPGMGYALEVQ